MTNIILSSFVVIGAASALFGFLALADGLNGVALGFRLNYLLHHRCENIPMTATLAPTAAPAYAVLMWMDDRNIYAELPSPNGPVVISFNHRRWP